MISEEPDEDADALDDENLLETYAGGDPSKQQSGPDSAQDIRDWPLSCRGADVDAGTLALAKTSRTKLPETLECAPARGIIPQAQPLPDIQPTD
jgi:hypothetical protein